MTSQTIVRLVGVAVLGGAAICGGAPLAAEPPEATDAEPPRSVTLAITFAMEDGTPLAGYGLSLVKPVHDAHFVRPGTRLATGVTDDRGSLTLTVEVDPGTKALHIMPFGHDPSGPVAEQRHLFGRSQELGRSAAVPTQWRIPLDGDATERSVRLTLRPAVTVRGRIRNAEAGTTVMGSGSLGVAIADANGGFELAGVEQGRPATFIVAPPGDRLFPQHLTARQTRADINLGRIRLAADRAASVDLDVTLTNRAGIPYTTPSVLLLRTDGSIAYRIRGWRVIDEATATLAAASAPVTAGEYFILPTDVVPSKEVWAVLDAIRDGVDLSGSGIRRVALTAGQRNRLDVELGEIQRAVRQFMGE